MAIQTQTDQTSASLEGERLREALRLMLTIRLFDERALALYRAGEMRGTTHPYIGMEAVGVGVTLALRPDDYVTSTHRRHGQAHAGRQRHRGRRHGPGDRRGADRQAAGHRLRGHLLLRRRRARAG